MTTSLIPLKQNSNKCKNAILSKTLLVPVIVFNTSTTFSVSDGLLQKTSENGVSHTLLSEDSILSKTTTLFGRRIQIIGRTCEVSNTIPSGNFLIKNYSFSFHGEIEITENCPINGSMISVNWTFKSQANITLPLAVPLTQL